MLCCMGVCGCMWLYVFFGGGRVMVTGMGDGAMCVVLRLSVVFL